MTRVAAGVKGSRHLLRNQLVAQSSELLIGDRPRFFETIKLLDFVGSAEADRTPQLFTCLLRLLAASLRHAPRLSDHVREYRKIGEHDQRYHPDRLAPAGYVVTPEQVAYDDDEEPEPQDEHEYGEGVGQEIAESEAFRDEEHGELSFVSLRDGLMAGVAGRLGISRCLRHASDLCG